MRSHTEPGAPRALPAPALRALLGLVSLAALASCTDLGEGLAPHDDGTDAGGSGPAITALVPARTVLGDTVRVIGREFGSSAQAATVRFTAADAATGGVATILAWSDETIVALVPADAIDGPVRVRTLAGETAGPVFEVATRVTYAGDVVPLLDRFGCTACHGGSGGLDVVPWSGLMRGDSDHGPVVVPRRSDESLLWQRLVGRTPSGARMPEGGPYLLPEEIRVFADWIDQGARND